MTDKDPISDLLRLADQAAGALPAPANLVGNVQRRRVVRSARAKRVKIGLLTGSIGTAAAVLALVAIHAVQSPVIPIPSAPVDGQVAANSAEKSSIGESTAEKTIAAVSSADAAQLKAEAAALDQQAGVLEKLIARQQQRQRLEELSTEHDRLLVDDCAPSPAATAIDRTAGAAVCQAEFLADTLGNRTAAIEAYQNISRQYPNTSWAEIAEGDLARLQMN